MQIEQSEQAAGREYLSWLPSSKLVQRASAGSGPLTLVRTSGEACDDPATPYLGVQLVIAGEAHLECDFARGTFRKHFAAGDFVVVPPNTDVRFSGPGHFEALALAIPERAVAGHLELYAARSIEEFERLFDRPHNDVRLRRLIEMLWEGITTESAHEDLFADGMLQSLLAALLDLAKVELGPTAAAPRRGAGLGNATLARLRDYVRDSLREGITLDALAGIAGMSPSHFSREFKASTGHTPMQYVSRTRVDLARQLLASSRHSLSEVADLAGFCDQSHLNRHFKREVGVTPGRFRRELRA